MAKGESSAPQALERAESAYRDTLAALRLAQLYLFWLLLEALLRPVLYLFQHLTHLALGVIAAIWPGLSSGLAPGAPPGTELLTGMTREPAFVAALIAAGALFAINARMRTHWALWPAAAAIALYNLDLARRMLIGPDARAFAELRLIRVEGRTLDFAADVDAALWAMFAVYVVFHVHILYLAFRAQRSLAATPAPRRAAIADIGPEEPVAAGALRRLLYLPAALRFGRRRVFAGGLLLLAGISNLINYWLALMAAIGLAIAPMFFAVLGAIASPGGGGGALGGAALGVGLLIAIVAGAAFCLTRLVALLTRAARRVMRRSLEDMQAADRRAPVLFLRSFLDDQVALPTREPTWEQWLLDASSRSLNFDLIALEEGSAVGPVVALGDPSDPAPPYGAARGYFDHDDWQAAVAQLCDKAAAVILVLDETEGVKWEIARLSSTPLRGKTLYLLAPGDIDAPRGRTLMRRALRSVGADEARADVDGFFAFWEGPEGEVVALSTRSRSAYAYLIALRAFLRRGGDASIAIAGDAS